MVANKDVPCKGPIVREHYRVAHFAIMPNMAVGKEVPAIPDACFACARGTSIDGYEFAKRVFLADFQDRLARHDISNPAFADRWSNTRKTYFGLQPSSAHTM